MEPDDGGTKVEEEKDENEKKLEVVEEYNQVETKDVSVSIDEETENAPNKELSSTTSALDAKVNFTKNSDKFDGEYRKTGFMRHYVAIFALVGIVLANMNRQAFNQALVKMVPAPHRNNLPVKIETDEEFVTTQSSNDSITIVKFVDNVNSIEDRFDWDSKKIAILQSAFSYGYIPLMVVSARISELYGAKWVIFISGFGSAICCILSPFFADSSFEMLVISRVIMGLCQTGVSPALYALLVRWLSPEESSVYLPMMKVGATLGFMFGSVIAGAFSWRQTFYVVGGVGFIWSFIWPLTVQSDPNESALVNQEELNYINQEIRKLNRGRKQSAATARKKSAPWIQIFTHPVVLAFMFTKLTVKISTDAQTQQFGMYLSQVFNLNESINGLLNGFNHAIQALFTGLVAWSASEFVKRKVFGLNKTGVRHLFQGICNFGMGAAYILITFNMSSIFVVCAAFLLLSISAMFGAGGEAVLPIDLTNDYAATIMSIANFTANLSGIILPQLVAAILQDDRSDSFRWNLIWWIVGGMMMVGGIAFTFFVKAELIEFEGGKLATLVNRCLTFCGGNRKKAEKSEDDELTQTKAVQLEVITSNNA